jgi:hypothetical protein
MQPSNGKTSVHELQVSLCFAKHTQKGTTKKKAQLILSCDSYAPKRRRNLNKNPLGENPQTSSSLDYTGISGLGLFLTTTQPRIWFGYTTESKLSRKQCSQRVLRSEHFTCLYPKREH